MRKLIVSEWISLDGVFDAGSMHIWWDPFDSLERQNYIQRTIQNCDIMLFGRNTYQMLHPYWSSFDHNEQGVATKLNTCRKIVVSTTMKNAEWGNSTIIASDFLNKIRALKLEDGGPILMMGSASLLKPLMEAGLVDELKLLVNPAIVGYGERLFFNAIECGLKSSSVQRMERDVVFMEYLVSETK